MGNGKFLNTVNKITVDHMIEGLKKRLDNPYYVFNDKKPTPTTYYNLNTGKSTLDEASKQAYSQLGGESPFRYNKINGAYLYGLERMTTELDIGDFGLESSPIEGEFFVLPNTFVPYNNDFFVIDYIGKQKLMFRVTGVTTDTLENGANFYKATYKLDQYNVDIANQVVDEFTMNINTVGTEFKSVIKSTEYDFISLLEDITSKLKEYYFELFFDSRVQTFTYRYGEDLFYDGFLIEFLIRNGIMTDPKRYTYVTHQTHPSPTFSMEYDKSFFRNVEIKNKKIKLRPVYAMMVQDPLSILTTRLEDYFEINYNVNLGALADPIPTVDLELVNGILENTQLDDDHGKRYYNIIVDYFNGPPIKSDVIEVLESIEYSSDINLFYNMPILIFILEKSIINLLKKDT